MMTDSEYMNAFERLREIVASTLNVDAAMVRTTSTQGDLAAWDSMGHIHLMVALEEAFGIHLEVEDFGRLTSVPAILDHLAQQRVG
jgi:acyl carrier protein